MSVIRLDVGQNGPSTENVIALLHEAASAIQDAKVNARKGLVLLLDDSDNSFTVRFFNAGMRMSECVALIECAKMRFLNEMGYLSDE